VKLDNEKFVEVNATEEKTSGGSEWAEQFAQEKYKLNPATHKSLHFSICSSFSFNDS
jgi:hypothetical protein